MKFKVKKRIMLVILLLLLIGPLPVYAANSSELALKAGDESIYINMCIGSRVARMS